MKKTTKTITKKIRNVKTKKKRTEKISFKFSLSEIFKDITDKLRSEIIQSQKITSHTYSKGYYIEEIIREFLRKYFPPTLGVARGFIVDVDGNISNELDVIIFDQNKTPVFYSSGDSRVIPIETVIGVIEVKKNLWGNDLKSIFKNIESLNKLKKKAIRESFYSQSYFNVKDLKGKINKLKIKTQKEEKDYLIPLTKVEGYAVFGELATSDLPIMYSVFAYSSMSLNTIKNRITNFHLKKKLKPRNRISIICVFDKGLIVNLTRKNIILPFPSNDSKLFVAENTKLALKHYFGMLVDYLMLTDIRGGIRYTNYFKITNTQTKKI